MPDVSRRTLIKGTGMVGASMLPTALSSATASAQEHPVPPITPTAVAGAPVAPQPTTYLFLNVENAAFIEAAVARLIPADPQWPGGVEAGVSNYIDKQLGGAWGSGERLYRSGPWQPGTPSQGYQLPFTPAELFHAALRAINRDLDAHGTPFHDLSTDAQDAYLKSLESGAHDLDGVPSAVFFDMLLKMSVEGFFSDPVYGGNRDMVAWRMIGFPGAYADYFEAIDRHGVKFERAPMSMGEDRHGHVHVQ